VDAHLPRQVQLSGGSGKLGHFYAMTTSLPRPVLLALIGAVAVAGLFVVSRRGGEEAVPTAPAPSQTSQPTSPSAAQPEAPAQENVPQDKSAAPAPDKGAQGGRGLPSPVARALDDKKIVVLLFWNRKGVDDRSVKKSVDRLSRRGGEVAKFTETVNHLSRYTRITAAASVTQTPALVIVNKRGQAEVLNGYLDYQTISQFVANAARRK
jgi:pyruvate/2-oxoglutarate dehydrogenase complex dihydrolipoamide acyltransferase (E2) component